MKAGLLWVTTQDETGESPIAELRLVAFHLHFQRQGLGRMSLAYIEEELARRGINELHVEAGFRLNGSLVRERCVDEFLLYLNPSFLGDAAQGLLDLYPNARKELRWVAPREAGACQVYLSNYGGGLLAGDEIRMRVECHPDSRLYLGTQASTKIYRSASGKTGVQETIGTLHAGAIAVVCPDPVVPFARQEDQLTLAGAVVPAMIRAGGGRIVVIGARGARNVTEEQAMGLVIYLRSLTPEGQGDILFEEMG